MTVASPVYAIKAAFHFLTTEKNPAKTMTICEFCVLQQADKSCLRGLTIPKKMRCLDFAPGIERFCQDPTDYKGGEQLHQMASYFGLRGKELKRVHELARGQSLEK